MSSSSTLLELSSFEGGDGSLFLRSFPVVCFFFANRGSEVSLDFCASDLGGGALEADLSSAALPAAALFLGTKLPAEHLLVTPSSFRYFLTLFMAFIAEAEAAQRSFSTLLASSGSSIARSSISVSRMWASELSRPPTLSTNTADFSE